MSRHKCFRACTKNSIWTTVSDGGRAVLVFILYHQRAPGRYIILAKLPEFCTYYRVSTWHSAGLSSPQVYKVTQSWLPLFLYAPKVSHHTLFECLSSSHQFTMHCSSSSGRPSCAYLSARVWTPTKPCWLMRKRLPTNVAVLLSSNTIHPRIAATDEKTVAATRTP
jgi:hypothetical protein